MTTTAPSSERRGLPLAAVLSVLLLASAATTSASAFVVPKAGGGGKGPTFLLPRDCTGYGIPSMTTAARRLSAAASDDASASDPDDVLNRAIAMMSGAGGGAELETPDMVQGRIQGLVEQHTVLLFMKGNPAFPQCGFSDTATKILNLYKSEVEKFEAYHAVDVLSDPQIREGIKVYSQWPTIPQLYVGGEFVGGSDIMLEMHESGELKSLISAAFEE